MGSDSFGQMRSLAPQRAPLRWRSWAQVVLAAAAAWAATAAWGPVFAGARWQGGRSSSPAALRVGTQGLSGNSVVLVRPKAKGFQPDDRPDARQLQPVFAGFAKQDFLFFDYTNKGYPVSEIFFRFEGKTPWRKLGEVVSTTGDFKEAVRAQWTLLIEHTYYISKKARFWLPSEYPIKFGYADEQAEIVTVEEGPLPEGTPPLELKAMLKRCGFHKQEKALEWLHMHTKVKSLHRTKKDWLRKKPHLLHRERNSRVEAHTWYNPHKYRGRYMEFHRGKRGIVSGQGPSR